MDRRRLAVAVLAFTSVALAVAGVVAVGQVLRPSRRGVGAVRASS